MSEPTTVDPATAQAAIAKHPRSPEEVAKAMMDFEIRIGNHFAGSALPSAKEWICGPQYTPKAGSDNYPQGGIDADVKSIADWEKFNEEFNAKAIGKG